MRKILVGVMGPGEAARTGDCSNAYALGQAIARHSWVLVTGGRGAGVMEAALRGARDAGGLTVGILPSSDAADASDFVDVPIVTGLGQARNNVNVLSCRLIFACGMGAGTASEVSLALKAGRHAVLVAPGAETAAFFMALDSTKIHIAHDVTSAIELAETLLPHGNAEG